MKKERIDKILVERGLVETRHKAQALILAGQILANNQRVDKVGQQIDIESEIRIKGEKLRYVSRAGLKLEAALAAFKVDASEKNCLDLGASTGGFTDCLLQNGARHVVALDVGHSQLAWQLRQDSRVEARDRVNARFILPSDFDHLFDLITADLSFISLTKVLPSITPLLVSSGDLIVLIKPQFEVGKGEVGKGGIVTNPEKQARVVREISAFASDIGLYQHGLIASPITGADGNREFLARFRLDLPSTQFDLQASIRSSITISHKSP